MPYQIYLRPTYPNELYHHGIKGQKWGVRRFQNPDGTLTAAGKKRYLDYGRSGNYTKKELNEYTKNTKREYEQRKADAAKAAYLYRDAQYRAAIAEKEYKKSQEYGTTRDNIYDNKKLAKYKDANAQAEFWKKKNAESVRAVKDFTKNANQIFSKYGKKPLKEVKTKELENGEQVVNNKLRTGGEQTAAEVLAMTAMLLAGGGPISGAIYGGVKASSDIKVTKKYGERVESENKFYKDYYEGIYDAFNKEGIKIRLKDRQDELGYYGP